MDYGLLVICVELFGINYLLSATISFAASAIFNYLLSVRYVFGHREDMNRLFELVVFILLSAIGLLINDGFMCLCCEFLAMYYLLAKLIATFVVMIWNFISRKKLLMGK